jgi:flagellar biogenesis protein FliO
MFTSALLFAALMITGEPEEGISNLPAAVTTLPLRSPKSPEEEPTRTRDEKVEPANFESTTTPPALKLNPPASPKDTVETPPDTASAGAQEQPAGRKLTPRSERSRFSRRVTTRDNEPEEGEEALAPSSRRSTWWITTAIGLAVVLAVIYGGGRALRAFIPGMSVHEPTGPVQVLYRTFLSPKQVACLVRCGDRLLLIGLAGDRMQTLAEIRDPTEIDYIKGQCEAVRPRSTSKAFRDMFRKREEDWSAEEQGAPVTFATTGPQPATATHRPASSMASPSSSTAATPRSSGVDIGDFAKQLDAVRAKILAGKARSSG